MFGVSAPQRAPVTGARFHLGPLITLVALLATGTAHAAAPTCQPARFDAEVSVRQVYDGDTVALADGRRLCFIGINTPERGRRERPAEPLAEAARRFLTTRLPPGTRLRLRYDADREDRYHRLLAHPFLLDGTNLSAALIEAGLGFAIVVPPNADFIDCYAAAEARARAAGRGVWAEPYYAPREAGTLVPADAGFRRLTGTVQKLGYGRSSFYLDLAPGVAIRLHARDQIYFQGFALESLVGRSVTVRGWLRQYKGRWRMPLRHPAMLETPPAWEKPSLSE
ncbi:MAG TPA: thermonuclease family protein [Gammaproteobacteria bacterium]|nr:thermonuclease family protein [Gammaproteobacteria bacterium]